MPSVFFALPLENLRILFGFMDKPKKIKLTADKCVQCDGDGLVESYPWFGVDCPRCGGKGYVNVKRDNG